jgi:hypothetical protein
MSYPYIKTHENLFIGIKKLRADKHILQLPEILLLVPFKKIASPCLVAIYSFGLQLLMRRASYWYVRFSSHILMCIKSITRQPDLTDQ